VFVVGLVSYNWAYGVAVMVFMAGGLYIVAALITAFVRVLAARSEPTALKEPFVIGAALMATAIAIVFLFGEVQGDALFSTVTTSVSNAPGP